MQKQNDTKKAEPSETTRPPLTNDEQMKRDCYAELQYWRDEYYFPKTKWDRNLILQQIRGCEEELGIESGPCI